MIKIKYFKKYNICLLIILLVVCFMFVSVYNRNDLCIKDGSTDLSALSSSTTYYKNGSNFYTYVSETQHYHCTNSSHSGSNDYTSSSVSGTCYSYYGEHDTYSESHSVTTSNVAHSCSSSSVKHSCSSSSVKHSCSSSSAAHTCSAVSHSCSSSYCSSCGGTGKITCSTCNGNGYTEGGWLGNTQYGCSGCGGSGENGWIGDPYVIGRGWNGCSSCGGSGSTAGSGRKYTCSRCSGTWNSSPSGTCRYICSYCSGSWTYNNTGTCYTKYTCSHCHSSWSYNNTSTCYTRYTCSHCNNSWTYNNTGTCYTNYTCSHCSGSWTYNNTSTCYTNYSCTQCGKTSTSSLTGSHYYCKYCGERRNTTTYWDGGTCYSHNVNCSHSITTYYILYQYQNIDTGGTATTQSQYSTASGYTVYFNNNGGSGSMASQYFLVGHSQAIKTNTFTRTYGTFLGWSTNSSATSAMYSNGQSITNLNSGSGGTLYAVWQMSIPKPYISGTSNFTYNGSSQQPNVINYDSTYMTRSGDYSAKINVNTYTITYSLKSGYKWTDGTTSNVVLTWKILPKDLSDSGSISLDDNQEDYDGNTVIIASINPITLQHKYFDVKFDIKFD